MPEINIFDEARQLISPKQDNSILYIDEKSERILNFFFRFRNRSDFGDILNAYRSLGAGEQRVVQLTNFDWYDLTKLQMYIIKYCLKYIPRVQLNLIEILEKFMSHSNISVYLYDIGVGPGTTTVAFLTLIRRLYYIHNKSSSHTEFFIKKVHIIHSDKSKTALYRSKQIFDHMITCKNLDLQIPVNLSTEEVDFDQVDTNVWLKKLDNSGNVVNIICSFNTLNEINIEKFNQLAINITQLSISKHTYFLLGEYYSKIGLKNKLRSKIDSHILREDPKSLFNKFYYGLPDEFPGDWYWEIV